MLDSFGRPLRAFRQTELSPVSCAGRCLAQAASSGEACHKQVRYSHRRYENRRISKRDSLWGSAMPALLVAAPTDASRASERRCENEHKQSSWLYPVSSRDQDSVRPCAGPQRQYGTRRYYQSTSRLFGSRVRPSPVGEDRREGSSGSWTTDRRHNQRLRPYRPIQALMQQTIFFFLHRPCISVMRSKFVEPIVA